MSRFAIHDYADFATALSLADMPEDVRDLARTCITDAVACAAFGARFAWSRMLREQVLAASAEGPCRLPLLDLPGLPADKAALLAGAFAHAFELDSLRKPGAGVHPGATVALPALLVAQEVGADEEETLRAVVAGIEVMFRIGTATLHSAEDRGFHAPSMTGPFGAAVAAGLLYGLSREQLAAALGLAGSMGGGILAFAGGGGGAMVKRLHLGRAAEAGVLACQLARRGYQGPASAVDGRFGVLAAYCPRSDPSRLTAGLGREWETRHLCIKRYACHVTAQAPVELLQDLRAEHGFAADDIVAIELGVSAKVLSHHADRSPPDTAGAQYSVPVALALSLLDDPDDPMTFARNPADAATLIERICLCPYREITSKWGCEMEVRLTSGAVRSATREAFAGTPEQPLSKGDVARKVRALTGEAPRDEGN
jgi:2-methylcitrate dehydratase PrpD